MSLKKYETLIKTVDLGSLTRASEELGYTQSAISQILSGLEGELDLKLLIRDRAGVRLTEAGSYLLPAIRRVCEANDEVQRQVAALHGQQHACLRIGCFTGIGVQLAAPLLSQFSAQHPDVHFALTQDLHSNLCLKLEEGFLDCAFLCWPHSNTLHTLPVMDLPLMAVFPPDWTHVPNPYPIARLGELPLLLQEEEDGLHIQAHIRATGCEPKVFLRSSDDHAMLTMVKHSLGMTILPAARQRTCPDQDLIWRPLTPAKTRPVSLVFRDKRSLSPIARHFIHFVREEAILPDDANES